MDNYIRIDNTLCCCGCKNLADLVWKGVPICGTNPMSHYRVYLEHEHPQQRFHRERMIMGSLFVVKDESEMTEDLINHVRDLHREINIPDNTTR